MSRRKEWKKGVKEGYIDPDARVQWLACLDDRVCEDCTQLHNEIVELESKFPMGDPPVHDECRCTIVLTDVIPDDINSMTDEQLSEAMDALLDGS